MGIAAALVFASLMTASMLPERRRRVTLSAPSFSLTMTSRPSAMV
ncbi:MAG: hypothetical protein RMI04_08960 [Thermofilaceae archaeon]|nr:hypothetical protein [Thermofilaceae archaeon]